MKPLDEFLKASLKDYKVSPSESEKSKFLKDVVAVTGKTGLNKKWIYFGFIGGVLLIIGLLVYFLLSIHPQSINKSAGNSIGLTAGTKSRTVHQVNNLNSVKAGSVPGSKSKANIPVSTFALTKTSSIISVPQRSGQTIFSQSVTDVPVTTIPRQTIPGTLLASLNAIPMQRNDYLFPVTFNDNIPGAISKVNNAGIMPADLFNDSETNPEPAITGKKEKTISMDIHTFSAGAYYEPELMFNLLKEDKHMMVNNFGLKGEYYFGAYSIGTGIGLSITRGTDEIAFGYNEYLGTFKKLDSITFKWNQYHTHPVPSHYYYSDHAYYNSKVSLGSSTINRQYIYLQIPLTLGYDFIRNNRIRIGIRIGPTLSMLLQTTPKEEDVSHGKDRIVQINDISADRIAANFQFNGGIAAGIRLTRILELEAEPVASYYFNSVYEKGESDKKPWSLGFRVSLLIRNH
jgi:hypothetical protein